LPKIGSRFFSWFCLLLAVLFGGGTCVEPASGSYSFLSHFSSWLLRLLSFLMAGTGLKNFLGEMLTDEMFSDNLIFK
jgi:hypothetical protein